LTQPFPVGQTLPQEPQLRLSEARSTQLPAHASRPGRQPDEQAPPEHASMAAHVTPQPPQFFGSALVGMQTPLHDD
jgi:hypothetical protein